MGTYEDGFMAQYRQLLLNAVNHLNCSGRFQFFGRNGFSYIKVRDDFSRIPLNLIQHDGFKPRPMMLLQQHSPRTHISVLTGLEQTEIMKNKHKLREVD